MRIKEIRLNQFKRFTDLTITEIPESAKLVIIAGPNGCGKSSLFDGLKTWHSAWKGSGLSWVSDYHVKQGGSHSFAFHQSVNVSLHDPDPTDTNQKKKALYIRTAYRNDPSFKTNGLQKMGPQLDENRFTHLYEIDAAVGKNYQRLASNAFEDMFVGFDGEKSVNDFRVHVLGEIRDSLRNVFPDLNINNFGNPLEDGTFFFEKGKSKKFDYKNLSGGEKAAFDLILDMVVKKNEYNDTIFCIDEPELHMNSRLQGSLLVELFRLLGKSSQLWIATHSIGMMRRSLELAKQYPGKVVFLDFDNLDFDEPQVVKPIQPNRRFWEGLLKVALDDLAELVTPKQIIICEGVPKGTTENGNEAFDADCLNAVFSNEFPDTLFLSGGSSTEVVNDRHAIFGIVGALSKGADTIRLIDRDDHAPGDVASFQAKGIRVTSNSPSKNGVF